MQDAVISLIVPCYNVANKCDRFFQSLAEQTYTNIQLILIDDGSKDDTKQKLFSYKEALEEKGYLFEYYYQDNKGLGGAINTGLKKVRGDFLCWADPDDYFEPDSFEMRLRYMQEHPDCAIVSSDAYSRKENDLENKNRISKSFPNIHDPKQFEAMLELESMCCAGCHMIRMECFRKVNPAMDIYENRRGQNPQLLLPIYYHYDRDYLDVPLYNYIKYSDSMQRSVKGYDEVIERNNNILKELTDTVYRIEMPQQEQEKYERKLLVQDARLDMYAASRFGRKNEYFQYFRKLKSMKALSLRDVCYTVKFYITTPFDKLKKRKQQ